jgi:hypothetical protein
MISFHIDNPTKKDLSSYHYQLNNYIAYGYLNKKQLQKSHQYIIFLFAFIEIYKDVLNGYLNDISDLMEKLEITKVDILKNLRIDKDLNIYFTNSIRDKIYQIEYGKPGIIHGTPATGLFTKFNAFMKIQYDEMIATGRF